VNLLRKEDYPPEELHKVVLESPSSASSKGANTKALVVLIVTNFPHLFTTVMSQAVLVRTCRDALYELQKKSFKAIFCDLGPLGPDENGFRFAYALKSKETKTPLFLMTDQMSLEDETHAMHQGAKGLITRSAASLSEALKQETQIPASPFRVLDQSFAPISEQRPLIPLEALDRIKSQLRRHIGPVADDLVFKTLATIGKRHPMGVPFHALVHALANYIDAPKARDRFLTELGV
jgi:hypothetical protein